MSLRTSISNTFPSGGDAAGPEPTLGETLVYYVHARPQHPDFTDTHTVLYLQKNFSLLWETKNKVVDTVDGLPVCPFPVAPCP